MNLTITIDSSQFAAFLKESPEKIGRAMQDIIRKASLLVEREGKINAPVDTGRLRASISTDIFPLSAEVHTNVNYAIYVHEGTRHMRARPFMYDAVRSVESQMGDLVTAEIKKVLS
jgi:HK97 gp10 family phage protein